MKIPKIIKLLLLSIIILGLAVVGYYVELGEFASFDSALSQPEIHSNNGNEMPDTTIPYYLKKRRDLYNDLSSEYELPSFEVFNKKLDNPSKRKDLYDDLESRYDIGDFSSFESKITPPSIQDKRNTPAKPEDRSYWKKSLVLSEYSASNLIITTILVYSVGILIPVLIRYFRKKPFSKKAAIVILGIWWFIMFVTLLILKDHKQPNVIPLMIVMSVSYGILTSGKDATADKQTYSFKTNLKRFRFRIKVYLAVLISVIILSIIFSREFSSKGFYRFERSSKIQDEAISDFYYQVKDHFSDINNLDDFTKLMKDKETRKSLYNACKNNNNINLRWRWPYSYKFNEEGINSYEEFEEACFSRRIWVKEIDKEIISGMIFLSILIFAFAEFFYFIYSHIINKNSLVRLFFKRKSLELRVKKIEEKERISNLTKKLNESESND